MKKLLIVLFVALSSQMYSQYKVQISLHVIHLNGGGIANQPVTIKNGGAIFNFVTNSAGMIIDSLSAQGTGTYVATTALNGCADTAIFHYSLLNNHFTDTLVLCSTPAGCNFAIGATHSAFHPLQFNFWYQPNNPATAVVWYFGDGDSSTINSPTHTYSAPGTYIYCVSVQGCPQVCDTLVVTYTPGTCQASFIIDTVNSKPGSVVVWNNSTPTYQLNSTTQYLWDFGDGNTSIHPFPTHTYAGAGTYVLCLSINIPPTALDSGCFSLYCDTLKVDSLGNIVYKSTGASFTLNVLNANAISVKENVATEFSIYPNPTTDIVKVDFNATVSSTLTTEILDINGRVILREIDRTQNGNNQLRLDVSRLTGGVYFIRINLDGEIYYEKIIKQ